MPDETRETPPFGAVSRWLAPAALLVAVVAVALAIWGLVSGPSKPADSAALPGDPKVRVCGAIDTVTKAVSLQTHTDLGQDPLPQAAVAGSARLALFGGGQYLLNQLDSATPQELADAVREFGTELQDIGMNALAGVPNSAAEQAARLVDADGQRKRIAELCK
ncbi:MAG: hypothetical protein QOD39_2719 [Mycobacterium sp.]|nr:hypothetical protein [Mycobacterium sp.]